MLFDFPTNPSSQTEETCQGAKTYAIEIKKQILFQVGKFLKLLGKFEEWWMQKYCQLPDILLTY